MTDLEIHADRAFENYKDLKRRVTERAGGDCMPMLEWHHGDGYTAVSMAMDGSVATLIFVVGMELIKTEGPCERIVFLSEGYHINLPPGTAVPEPHVYLGDLFKAGDPRVKEDVSMMAIDRDLKIYGRSIDFIIVEKEVIFDEVADDVSKSIEGPVAEAMIAVMKASMYAEATRS